MAGDGKADEAAERLVEFYVTIIVLIGVPAKTGMHVIVITSKSAR